VSAMNDLIRQARRGSYQLSGMTSAQVNDAIRRRPPLTDAQPEPEPEPDAIDVLGARSKALTADLERVSQREVQRAAKEYDERMARSGSADQGPRGAMQYQQAPAPSMNQLIRRENARLKWMGRGAPGYEEF